jgi:hypothetical protein
MVYLRPIFRHTLPRLSRAYGQLAEWVTLIYVDKQNWQLIVIRENNEWP